MVDYFELAGRAQKSGSNLNPVTNMQRTDPEARRLLATGLEAKERGEKTIWPLPDAGGVRVSQEMAVHLLESKSTKKGGQGA